MLDTIVIDAEFIDSDDIELDARAKRQNQQVKVELKPSNFLLWPIKATLWALYLNFLVATVVIMLPLLIPPMTPFWLIGMNVVTLPIQKRVKR